MGFQGSLFTGTTPVNDTVDAEFTFYDASSGGSVQGTTITQTIAVSNGYFGTRFSQSDISGVDFTQALWVEVKINGNTLSPRSAINSVPVANNALGVLSYASAPTVGTAGSLYYNNGDEQLYISNGTSWVPVAIGSGWEVSGDDVSFMGGNVGIDTINPEAKLHVESGDVLVYNGGDGLRLADNYSDSNRSGLFFAGADQVIGAFNYIDNRFEYGGQAGFSPSLVIDYLTGNIGIGTTTPIAKLDIVGLNGGNAQILQDQNGEYDGFRFFSKDTNLGYNGDVLMTINPEEGFYLNQGASTIALNDYDTTITGYTNIMKDSSFIKLYEYDGPNNTGIDMFVDAGEYDYQTLLSINPETGFRLESGAVNIESTIEPMFFKTMSTDVQYLFTGDGQEFMRIQGGNVGIGTTTPTSKLTVDGEILGTSNMTLINQSGIFFPDSPAGFGVIGYGGVASEFGVMVDDGYVAVKNNGKFYYGTNNGSGGIVIDEATGNIGIGTSTPTQALSVVGTIFASNLLGGATTLSTDANGNIIRSPSDQSLKENINTIENALDKISQLRGVSYEWLDKARFGSSTEIGVIAQEVEQVVPEVVSSGGAYKSVKIANLVGLLIEAVKELKTKVDTFASWFSGNSLKVKGDICVDDVCITKDQFKQMLQREGGYTAPSVTTPTPAPTVPVVESTPEQTEQEPTEPEPVSEPVITPEPTPEPVPEIIPEPSVI
jgi:hypothetical protein